MVVDIERLPFSKSLDPPLFPIKIIEKYPWTSSFLSTLQVCKLWNELRNELLCRNLSRLFSSYSSNTCFLEPLQTAASEPSRTAKKKNVVHEIDSSMVHVLVKAILFRQNSFIRSRGVNRLIISRYFWLFSKIDKNSC